MVAMTRLAAREGAGFGIDPTRLAVGGDSAGGNLALAAALALRDAGETALKFQLLIYGVYSADSGSPSWQRFGQGAGLSQTQMRWIWETYLADPAQKNDWRAAPILADLKGVAPAHLIVGSLDPLLDDSHNLETKLKAAGVSCSLTVYQGINHGFIRYGRLIGTSRRRANSRPSRLAKPSPAPRERGAKRVGLVGEGGASECTLTASRRSAPLPYCGRP
jgi:acetyl esterase